MSSPQIQRAQQSLFTCYGYVKLALSEDKTVNLRDLQHEADDLRRQMTQPFSERVAAEMVYVAASELLEEKTKGK